MLRMFAIFGVAAVLAVSAPVGSDAFAKGKKAVSKSCKATGLDGKKVSFKCKSTQICCFDALTNKGSCVDKGGICL
ncbi:MAG: hypothetical protein ACOYLQ_10790 [Hyphomicrobiaceae bacterium]|jgi:hypothetical protein